MNRTLSIVAIGVVSAAFCRQASAWEQPAGARVITEGSSCDYPGSDYRQDSASDDDDCGNQCLVDTYCRAWAYNASNHKCYLKNAAPAQKAAGSERICGFIDPRWEWDIDRPGNDIALLWAGTPDACESACGSTPNCNMWTFNEVNAQIGGTSCYLKSGVPSPVEKKEISVCTAENYVACGSSNGITTYCYVCATTVTGHFVSGLGPN
jgi:PAN domain